MPCHVNTQSTRFDTMCSISFEITFSKSNKKNKTMRFSLPSCDECMWVNTAFFRQSSLSKYELDRLAFWKGSHLSLRFTSSIEDSHFHSEQIEHAMGKITVLQDGNLFPLSYKQIAFPQSEKIFNQTLLIEKP